MASKIYIIDGKKWQFNFTIFNTLFRKHSLSAGETLSSCEETLAQELNVTASAVHMWRNYKNAPGDIDLVKGIAAFYKVSDYISLLTPYKEDVKMVNLSERQLDSVKRIYDQLVKFLCEFSDTDGFQKLHEKYVDDEECPVDPDDRLITHVNEFLDVINCTILQEYIFLRSSNIHNELCAFYDDDILTLSEKSINIACGYKASEDGWVHETFITYLNKLDDIVHQYV